MNIFIDFKSWDTRGIRNRNCYTFQSLMEKIVHHACPLLNMFKNLLLVLMMLSGTVKMNSQPHMELLEFGYNKRIPPAIEKNVLTALSFYPELKNTRIKFVFKKKIKYSVMQAQPVFSSLLRKRRNRRYRINISEQFKLTNARMPIIQIPDTVMIGWIGHELGHILDYKGKKNVEMISFGWRYYFNSAFMKKAEMIADSLAVERGMGHYIVATKRFILDHADLPQAYKDRISRLYVSPDVIMEQVRKLEEKKEQQKHHP